MRAILLASAIGGISMNACGFLGFGGTSWKEEVLLHDGTKMVVERWVKRGGRHEIGQQPPIKEQGMTFALPTTNERITWKSEHSEDVGLADFQPLLLDIVQGVPYVVSTLVGCLSYNKWGRPNPPYMIFKYEGNEWKRVTMQALPEEMKTPNMIYGSPDNTVEKLGKDFVTSDEIKTIVGKYRQPEYRSILREPIKPRTSASNVNCEEMVYYKGAWVAPGDSIGKRMMDRRSMSRSADDKPESDNQGGH